nr:ABC transporter permease [Bdellovibrio sp. CKG001]BFD62525.1 ABC transporter permease [Bdellovibrio sp. HM001]
MKLRDLFLLPAALWFAVFILLPVLIVVIVSFATRGTYGGLDWTWTLQNYSRAFSSTYLGIFLESFQLALLTTFICLVVGVLISWAMATTSPGMRQVYLMAMVLPFLTNLVIRIYAIRMFVGVEGPLQAGLSLAGVPFDPYALTQNKALVLYGMVTTYLPFMVLPVYGAFEKFDFSLVEAAQDLGAGIWRILFTVILPNLKMALWAGSLLVFIPSLGEYVIPDLLGGAKTMLYGNLITEQFLKSRDWPFGAALSVLMMVLLLGMAALFRLWESRHGK